MNRELPDVQAGFRKSSGTRDQITHTCWIIEKAREFQNFRKIYSFTSLITLKPLTVWITTNWKICEEMAVSDYLIYLLRNLYEGQEATELDLEQRTGSKLGKEYVKAVFYHSAYLTYMQNTSC